MPKRTYNTASCRLPKLSSEFCARAIVNGSNLNATTSYQSVLYAFSLDQTNLGTGFFDSYCIEAVRFSIVPNMGVVGTTPGTQQGSIYCVIDYDDTSALPVDGTANAYTNVIRLMPGESLSRVFRPRILMPASVSLSGSPVYTGAVSAPPTWLEATNVAHLGVKLIVNSVSSTAPAQSWSVVTEYFVRFRYAV